MLRICAKGKSAERRRRKATAPPLAGSWVATKCAFRPKVICLGFFCLGSRNRESRMRKQKSVTSNQRLKILIIPVLSLLWLFMSLPSVFSYDNYVVSPDEVLIIVNDNYYDRDGNGKSDSVDVGEYYALQRGIPPENICHVSYTNSEIEQGVEHPLVPSYRTIPNILKPIKDYLETTTAGSTLLKDKIYYMVTTLGIPVKYWNGSALFGYGSVPYDPVDRQIEDMYIRREPSYDGKMYHIPGSEMNKIYDDLYRFQDVPARFKDVEKARRAAAEKPTYLVTRLDGPTLEIAKGLVDKAIYAENYVNPLSGNTYIDKYGLYDPYGALRIPYFDNLTSAFKDAGIPVTQIEDIYPDAPSWPGPYPRHTNRDYQPGDCPDAMYYFGWYQHWSKPRFEWRVGGIGAELQSYTAASIRSRRQAVPIMLHEGVTATIGFVDEPGLNDTLSRVLRYAVIKGLDFAESAQLGNGSGYRACRIGDPLYNLQRNAATRREDTFPPIIYNVNVKTDKSGVQFTWNTHELSWGYVEYGETATYGNILQDKFYIMNSDPTRGYYPKHYTKRHGIDPFHTFILSQGLSPNTEYHFRIKAVDPAGNARYSRDYSFITSSDTNFFTQTWSPEIAVWGYEPVTDYNTGLAGKTVRNYFNIKKFSHGGDCLRFHLQASSTKPLRIQDATIAEAQQTSFNLYVWNSSTSIYEKNTYSGSYISLNLKEDTKKSLTFNNGQNELYLNPGESAWSDWVQIPIDVNKPYALSFYVDPIDSGLTYACYGQTKTGGRTMDAVAWTFKGNVSAESDWAALINQETVDYEKLGNFTQSPNYSLGGTYGDYSIYGIDSIEVSLNRPPLLAPINNKTVDEGKLLQFTISASDPDGDSLTYSATNLAQGASFDSTTKTFSWTPNFTQAGLYSATFTVSDGALEDSETLTITVNNVNRAPVALVLSPNSGTFPVDKPYLFHTVFSDPDGCNDLSRVMLIFRSNQLPSQWLIAYYLKTTNKLYLYNGSTYIGGFTPGSNNVIDTPYGKLYCAQTTVSSLGNYLIVSWSLSFKSPLIGPNYVYLLAVDNKGANTGWIFKGYINIVIR